MRGKRTVWFWSGNTANRCVPMLLLTTYRPTPEP